MKRRDYILMALLALAIVVVSLKIGTGRGPLEGADGMAMEYISSSNKAYKPWFESIWAPPSGEIESALFALQTAIGGSIIGYYIGKKQNAKTNSCVCSRK